jgi:SAM-dependent methyltransferase
MANGLVGYLKSYTWKSGLYDGLWSHAFTRHDRMRQAAIDRLSLRPGDTVLDCGCGTGRNLPALAAAVGPAGTVFAFDRSPSMLARAARLVKQSAQAACVSLEEGNAESFTCPRVVDAALFYYVPDIVGSTTALDNLLRQVAPGGVVVAVGPQLPQSGIGHQRFVRWRHWLFIDRDDALDDPYSELVRRLRHVSIEQRCGGTEFVVAGRSST